MGLHDTFRTTTPIICPLDGAAIDEWKDDDGGTMLTWEQGRLTPLEADDPDPDRLFGSDGSERLPPFFGLRAYHADHDLLALGETDLNDVWTSFRLVEVHGRVLLPGEFWPPFREGAEPTPRFEVVRLWREGAGLNREDIARLTDDRERQRAELPSHGGNAVCRMWDWADAQAKRPFEQKDPAVALILGYPGFVCARHLAEHGPREGEIVLT